MSISGRLLSGLAQDAPGHIRAEVFAADRAVGDVFNLGASLSWYGPQPPNPLVDCRGRYTQEARQLSLTAKQGAGGVNSDGLLAHVVTVALLHNNVKPCSIFY